VSTRKRAAFTLTELVIACFMLGLIMSAVFMVFWSSRGTYGHAEQLFTATQQAKHALLIMRRDFEETALGAVMVSTGENGSAVTVPSWRDATGNLQVDRGLPHWTKYYVYRLEPLGEKWGLVRYDCAPATPLTAPLPLQLTAAALGRLNNRRLLIETVTPPGLHPEPESPLFGGGGLVVRYGLKDDDSPAKTPDPRAFLRPAATWPGNSSAPRYNGQLKVAVQIFVGDPQAPTAVTFEQTVAPNF
jgi:type II secretory pathway pseudopilin PulG